MKYVFIPLFLLVSCGNPIASKDASTLKFSDSNQEKLNEVIKLETIAQERKKFLEDKKRVWSEINADAKESFQGISEIIRNKCFSCHDANTKLPIYGRILPGINPVHKHQEDGLKALDFSEGFPFKATGNPPQISLLKSIRNAVTERTMPIRAYTLVYPHKKINGDDEKRILDWIDPVIEKLTEYELKYNSEDTSVPTVAHKVLEQKCYRCHANGNHKGSFENLQNTDELLKGKYINLDQPDQSKMYTIIASGKMPPNKLEALSAEELATVRDWLELEAKKLSKRP